MGLKSLVEGFLFKIALKKGVKSALGVLASINGLEAAGVQLDTSKLEQFLLSAGAAGVTMLLNFLKVKTKIGAKLL